MITKGIAMSARVGERFYSAKDLNIFCTVIGECEEPKDFPAHFYIPVNGPGKTCCITHCNNEMWLTEATRDGEIAKRK